VNCRNDLCKMLLKYTYLHLLKFCIVLCGLFPDMLQIVFTACVMLLIVVKCMLNVQATFCFAINSLSANSAYLQSLIVMCVVRVGSRSIEG